ncbi:MAG: hypothetical protein GY795_36020 [Desulfobacterales bacterium]|nr:hypothetical protein [Desulfobacterales bacterium]
MKKKEELAAILHKVKDAYNPEMTLPEFKTLAEKFGLNSSKAFWFFMKLKANK